MARLGYGTFAPEQFVGFLNDLQQGAWADVPTITPGQGTVSLHATPTLVYFKHGLTRAIYAVVAALGAANDVESVAQAWSRAERRFIAAIELLALDDDPAVVRDTARVRELLGDGGGTAMVNRSADDKVDFGRRQLALAATPEAAALVAKLGLGDRLDAIRERTQDLAAALGRDGTKKERLPRSRRIERAVDACAVVFNQTHEVLSCELAHTTDAHARHTLEALRAPFELLLGRRPAEAIVTEEADEESAEEPVALDPTG